jgi:hypothetical protein
VPTDNKEIIGRIDNKKRQGPINNKKIQGPNDPKIEIHTSITRRD